MWYCDMDFSMVTNVTLSYKPIHDWCLLLNVTIRFYWFAYCFQVLPQSAHAIKSTASKFLLSWLFQHEHEHRQWSAAISIGLISSSLHVTDHKQKFQNINGLLEVKRIMILCCFGPFCGIKGYHSMLKMRCKIKWNLFFLFCWIS